MESESSIPAVVAEKAAFYGVMIVERDDDFVALSDKLPGQEFDAMTAASALRAILKAQDIDYDAPIEAQSNGALPKDEAIVADMAGEAQEKKAPRKPRPSEIAKKQAKETAKQLQALTGVDETKPAVPDGAKIVADAMSEVINPDPKPAREPIETVTAKGTEKAKAQQAKRDAKSAETPRGKTADQAVAESPKVDPETLSEPEPKSNVVSLAEKRKVNSPTAGSPARMAAGKNAAETRTRKAAAEPVAEPKKAEAAKPKTKAKAAPKTKPEPVAKKKIDPNNDNGNGRPRGKRWAVKTMVLANPKTAPEDIFNELEKKGIDTKVQSVSSIRMDFLATARAAKELGKLKAEVAKRIPDARSTNRVQSNVLRVINKAVILHPEFDADKLKEHCSSNGEITVADLQKAGPISASRAAIIESIHVMRVAGALR